MVPSVEARKTWVWSQAAQRGLTGGAEAELGRGGEARQVKQPPVRPSPQETMTGWHGEQGKAQVPRHPCPSRKSPLRKVFVPRGRFQRLSTQSHA
jgi:hypothetical protein